MLKFTITIAILAFINLIGTRAFTREDLKDKLKHEIERARDIASDHVQEIKVSGANKAYDFITLVTDEIVKSRDDMEVLKKKYGNKDNVSCDKLQGNIDTEALSAVKQFQSCVDNVASSADSDLESLKSDAGTLIQEIENATNINEELHKKVKDYISLATAPLNKYIEELKKCETESNLGQLKQQISETLIDYEQCLRKK